LLLAFWRTPGTWVRRHTQKQRGGLEDLAFVFQVGLKAKDILGSLRNFDIGFVVARLWRDGDL
jgi:hypothetical protein